MKQKSGQLRIIGGEYRSRRLRFPAVEDLRPTPDAVRETLFNWLATTIESSTCLDLFAGSGALGFEALSRGASSVTLVESNRIAARQLTVNTGLLDCASRCRVVNSSAARFLEQCEDQFDVVFLDPPYTSTLLAGSIDRMIERRLLAADAMVYIETPGGALPDGNPPLPIPATWHIIRTKDCGLVRSHLIRPG